MVCSLLFLHLLFAELQPAPADSDRHVNHYEPYKKIQCEHLCYKFIYSTAVIQRVDHGALCGSEDFA